LKAVRKSQGKSVLETIKFLRGNLCILCTDPESDTADLYFKEGKFQLNEESVNTFITKKVAQLEALNKAVSECATKVLNYFDTNADATKCADLKTRIDSLLDGTKVCQSNCKDEFMSGNRGFGNKKD